MVKVLGIVLVLFPLTAFSFIPQECEDKPIKVAIIDTGFGFNQEKQYDARLCRYGHKDFTTDQKFSTKFETKDPVPLDMHRHGTNVTGIIDAFGKAGKVNYCLVIIKYYSPTAMGTINLTNSIKALNYARNLNVDMINYSGGGIDKSEEEESAVKLFLDQGGTFVAAAGNERDDLDEKYSYYPAMYDPRIVSVGNAKVLKPDEVHSYFSEKHKKKEQLVQLSNSEFGVPSESSNYGSKISRWEPGEDVKAYDIIMTGTSQSTAIATGKILVEKYRKRTNSEKNTCNYP